MCCNVSKTIQERGIFKSLDDRCKLHYIKMKYCLSISPVLMTTGIKTINYGLIIVEDPNPFI